MGGVARAPFSKTLCNIHKGPNPVSSNVRRLVVETRESTSLSFLCHRKIETNLQCAVGLVSHSVSPRRQRGCFIGYAAVIANFLQYLPVESSSELEQGATALFCIQPEISPDVTNPLVYAFRDVFRSNTHVSNPFLLRTGSRVSRNLLEEFFKCARYERSLYLALLGPQ